MGPELETALEYHTKKSALTTQNSVIVEVRGLKKYFPVFSGFLAQRVVGWVKAVDDVSFFIRRGETLGLVGESGCGKTTTGRCILQLDRPTEGSVLFEGQELAQMTDKSLRPLRRQMQIVFQDPYSSLNPRMTVGQIINEPIRVHRTNQGRGESKDQVSELLEVVGLNPLMADRYPHELSGGQRQRVGIARAVALKPKFIVCDEPVSALDVSIQAQVINLLEELQGRFGLTYLFIAHDLSVVRHISNRIAVMYLGKVVEIANRQELYENPLHPYTKALLSAVPVPDPTIEAKRERVVLRGEVPSALSPPVGCVFHPRCAIAIEDCSKNMPELREVHPDHWVACIRV
jgi:oligopeptide transport system ATP-binding protein